MRKQMPLRWIEEAEERQVLVLALCEAPAPAAGKPAGQWVGRIRGWMLSRQAPRASAMSAIAEPLDFEHSAAPAAIGDPSGFYC